MKSPSWNTMCVTILFQDMGDVELSDYCKGLKVTKKLKKGYVNNQIVKY